jgi:hypothetical protein
MLFAKSLPSPKKEDTPSFNEIGFNFGVVNYKGAMNVEFAGKLYLPKQSTENPHITEIHAALLEWAVRMQLVRENSRSFRTLEELKSAALFATPLHNEDAHTLFLLAKFTTFLFIFDNIIDDNLPKALGIRLEEDLNKEDFLKKIQEQLTFVFDHLFDCLSGKVEDLAKIPDIKLDAHTDFKTLCAALIDINKGIQSHSQEPTSRAYFLATFRAYLDSLLREVNNRYQQQSSDITDYYEIRKYTGAVMTTFAFIIYLLKIEIPSNMEEKGGTINNYIENAALLLSLHNDLASFQREVEEDSHENAISKLFDEYLKNEYSPNEALEKAIVAVCEKSNELTSNLYKQYSNLKKENKDFAQIAEAVELCLYDNFNWSVLISGRYNKNHHLSFSYHNLQKDDQKALSPLETLETNRMASSF